MQPCSSRSLTTNSCRNILVWRILNYLASVVDVAALASGRIGGLFFIATVHQHEFSAKEQGMSKVRVLVGTRKGAFILTSDGKREKWDVSGPHFAGWELYHLKGSPADPNRIYASQTSGWFGQVIQRSDDGGKTWHQPGTPPGETTAPGGMPKGESNKFVYDVSAETGKPLTTHQFYDGTQHPWEFKRVWHLEPSLTDPDTVYAGVEDAALFRSTDGGQNWHELSGLARPRNRPEVAARRGRHVPAHHHSRSEQSRSHLHRDLRSGSVSHR